MDLLRCCGTMRSVELAIPSASNDLRATKTPGGDDRVAGRALGLSEPVMPRHTHEQRSAAAAPGAAADFTVRPARPADGPQIERLVREGILPGYVDYESRRADEIRRSLGSDRERFLVAV